YRAGHPSNSYEWNQEVERKLLASLTAKEQKLLDLGVPTDALEWRRKTIMAKCFGDEDLFAQEYPSTLEEALEFRENCFFQATALKWHNKNVRQPVSRVRLTVDQSRQWSVALVEG